LNLNITVLVLIGLAMLAVVWATLKTESSPLPTSRSVLGVMLSLLPDRLPVGPSFPGRGQITELGSGWGGVAFALARRYPDHSVIGYELSILPWAISRLRLLLQPQQNLEFRIADFMRADLSTTTLAVCYLSPQTMAGLSAKMAQEMPVGALVLSNTFSIREWQALDRRQAPDMQRSPVYLYEIGNT